MYISKISLIFKYANELVLVKYVYSRFVKSLTSGCMCLYYVQYILILILMWYITNEKSIYHISIDMYYY